MEEKKGSNNLKKAKELIIQNKKKAILILIAIIAIATIAVFFMQSSNKMIINLGLNNKFKVDLTETTDVTVTSKFLNGGAYETPRVIGFQLKRESGELERDIYWTAPSTNTSYTFYGVPKYDENGKEIKYTVEQVVSSFDEEVMRPYITVINGTVITNTIKGNVTLTSKWVDSEAQKENRPSSVRMQLKNDKNTVFATKELPITTDKDEFTVTFEDVPLYDNDNQLINYTVDEEGTIPFYRKSVSGTVITNTFGTETVSVDANIQWDDYNNKYGRRPDGVTLSLKIGNKVVTYHTVSNEEGWKYKFEGLDKYNSDGQEIVYSVEAYAPYEGLLYYYENPDIVDARDMGEAGKQEATINIRVDELKLSEIPAVVKVKYIDQNTGREIQDTVTIEGHIGDPYSTTELTTDDYIKITSEGNTAGKMTELQTEVTYYYAKKTKIEGKNIDKETNEILPGGYIIEGWEGKEGFFDTFDRPEEIEGYKFVEKVGRPISPMPREETQVIYYYIKTTTDIIVNKVWNDNEIQAQRRPDSIIVVVKNGDKVIVEQEVTKENVVEGTGNQWSTVIKNLPRFNEEGNEITYTIEERAKNADDLKFYTSEVTEVADNQATIRSTFKKPEDKTSVTLTKTWVDNNNEAGKRPALIRFQVKEGNEVKTHIDTAVANDMGWVFDDLPKYNDNGEQIQYTVDEAEINPGDLKFYTKTIDGGRNITNTYTVPDENISVTVTKVWEDNEIQAQRRPTSVILILKHNDTEVARKEIGVENAVEGATNKWETSFENLQKYDERGNLIEYTVEEVEKNPGDLHFYKSEVGRMTSVEVDGKSTDNKKVTIKNIFTKPEDTTDISGTKTWVDNNNEAGKRPALIRFQVKEGNKVIKHYDTAVGNNMGIYFEDLPKYDDNGQVIQYKIDEAEINPGDLKFYTKTIDGGVNITNTFTYNTDKTDVTVTSKWVDNEVQKQKRPDKINIQLKNGNQVVQTKELPITKTEDEFTMTFEDLPKYDKYNNIINYTVDQIEDLQLYTKLISGTVITNTFTVPEDTISIEVNKQWEDQNDIFGKRPESIIVRVKTGEEVKKSDIISKKDDWKTKFEGLAKYDNNGQEIVYTVDELAAVEGGLFYYEEPQTVEVTDMEGTNKKQATLINRMEKVPGFVKIKYVDKFAETEIKDASTLEGIVGDNFRITEEYEQKISGYTLIEEPEEKTGTYTEATQEKVYYYAKNTKVIVKHIKKGTNEVLADEVEIEGYEGKDYTTESKAINNYVVTETTKNIEGKMSRDTIEVIYYYSPRTSVVVKYVDYSTNQELSPMITIDGYTGKHYETEQLQIPDYTLQATTNNTTGEMTENTIEVIYKYAKNTKLIIKYLEKDDTPNDNTDNTVLADEVEMLGYEGKGYILQQIDIPNYKFVEVVGNTTGEMPREQTEVIYYYAKATKATVQHIDRETGEILKEESKEGKVGDLFQTHSEDFEGYVLVESPEKPNVMMTKEEQIVKYYYAKISEGLVEKHIDDITGEVLYTEEHEGNEGDEYDIKSRQLEGYDVVEEKLPKNSKGKITTELIEVKYYYIRKASVKIQYIEKATGKKLADDVVIEGHQNDVYTSETKEIKGYALIGVPENANGNMSVTKNENGTYNTETVVTYYYVKQSAGVEEKHIDIKTNNVLASEIHKGNVGDNYNISEREFDGYKLVEEKLPANAKGKMTQEKIVVEYYYVKETKVRVEYIDKLTNEKILTEEITGFEGDVYETEEKKFDGYDLVEVPSNGKGNMSAKEIVVKYYYQRKAEVEVKYLEKGTNYQLIETETKSGYVGDDYKAEEKEIPYYKLVENTKNTDGKMTKEKITVVYYYEKLKFNMKIDKWVSNVSMNGLALGAKDFSTKDELYKLEIHRNKVNTADIRATYKIRVSNTGEIEGTVGKITDLIPNGFTFHQEDNKIRWEQANGLLSTDTLKSETIKPGEYKEIEIVLRWNKGEGNFGSKVNTVLMNNLSNAAGFEDINKDDNRSTSEMLFSIITGLDRNDLIIVIAVVQIVLAITIGLLLSYKKKEN